MIKIEDKSKSKAMDAETFAKLYLEHYNYLYKYAIKLTENIEDAQDLLQDTYEKVYFSKKHSINEKNFKYYMRASVGNEFNKFYKKKKKSSEFFDLYTDPEDIAVFMPEPEEFEKLVSSLSKKEQEMYDLRYKEGYSEKQIADMLGMKDSTVRSIFHRTNKKLKDTFKKLGIAVFILCMFISVTVAAVSMIRYIQDMFRVKNENLENEAVLDAIENKGWFQKSDMDYIDLGDGYKIKLDYFLLDEMSLYLVFDLESEKDLNKYNEFSLLDLRIEDENGELIYSEDSFDIEQYARYGSSINISHNSHNIKQLVYMYTDSFPASGTLNISFSKVALFKKTLLGSCKETINSNFETSVNLAEKFKNRNPTTYTSDNNSLRKAIISETGFYAIVDLDYIGEINAKLVDNNGVEHECFTSILTNYEDSEIIEYIVVSNYNDEYTNNFKLIVDNTEYELKNQP